MEKYNFVYIDIFLVSVLVVAVIYDLRFQKIPNWLTLVTFLLSVLYHAITTGLSGFIFALAGSVVGILVLILPYLMGGMGAGDAKLMGALGALLGPKGTFVAFLLTAIIGGLYALAILANSGKLGGTGRRYWFIFKTYLLTRRMMYLPPPEQEMKLRLKYGVAIALGTLLFVLNKHDLYEILHFN